MLYNKKEKAEREKERERSQRESDLKMEKAERRSGKVTEEEERDELTCSRTGLSLILTRDPGARRRDPFAGGRNSERNEQLGREEKRRKKTETLVEGGTMRGSHLC